MLTRVCLFAALASLAAAARGAEVDYLRDIKPLLTQYCVRCHGATKQEATLRVDTAAYIDEGGDSGPVIIPGSSKRSILFRVIAGTHEDIPRMPYKKPPLSAAEIALFEKWIDDGAASPEQEEPGVFEHWAYVAPQRPEPPAVKRADWPRNPIDRFILARLEQEGIAPASEADRVTLLRRVSLDLTGLPPMPAEVDAFLQDQRPDAYERAVERLLASPHYGERWARPWLDVARYADSNGYSIDAPRQIWKYRDWVVDAFNRDLPVDRFIIEQLAGDLLPNATVEQKVATGFNRNTQINKEGGIDPEQFQVESVMDRVNTFGTAFLGLTVACAQCHDHKFDPISQKEYYQLYAFFNSTVDDGHGDRNPIGGRLLFPDEDGPLDDLPAKIAAARASLTKLFDAHGDAIEEWRQALPAEERAQYRPSSLRAALDVPWTKQSFSQRRAVFGAARRDDPEFKRINDELRAMERREMRALSTLVMEELPEPRETVVFIKGDFTRPGEKVSPGTPAVLPPLEAANPARPTRLDLARWIVDPAHPLTARVFVNRIWQQYFGRGIVETENDFGSQGIPPSHPELLDWLATELVARGWSWKAMHRLIVTSATYRQSSRARPDLEIADPLNKLLARQSRLRLEAEIVRDVGLAASGLLVPTLGGPPVYPPQPDGVMSLGQVKREWNASTGPERYRRGLYTHFWRATPHPALAVFDAADGFSACTRRIRSNTPLQALTLLNDDQFFEFATALGRRVQTEASGDLPAQLEHAFRLCVARKPNAAEQERLSALYRKVHDTAGAEEAWTTIARVLLNLDETITRE